MLDAIPNKPALSTPRARRKEISSGLDRAKPQFRSRVSNGEDILPGVDGRSSVARRYRDISCAIVSDMGGADQCSESRLQLIRRFAAAAVLAEQAEARMANGGKIDVAEHCQLASTMVRIAHRIGIDRVPREVNPTLQLFERELRRLEAEDAP